MWGSPTAAALLLGCGTAHAFVAPIAPLRLHHPLKHATTRAQLGGSGGRNAFTNTDRGNSCTGRSITGCQIRQRTRRPRGAVMIPSMVFRGGGGLGGGGLGGGGDRQGGFDVDLGTVVTLGFALLLFFAPGVISGVFTTFFLVSALGLVLLGYLGSRHDVCCTGC